MQSWKESVFIGRKITRYLCLSKTEGISDYIVVNINIINEKECPPDGYCLIPRTIDSGNYIVIYFSINYKYMCLLSIYLYNFKIKKPGENVNYVTN